MSRLLSAEELSTKPELTPGDIAAIQRADEQYRRLLAGDRHVTAADRAGKSIQPDHDGSVVWDLPPASRVAEEAPVVAERQRDIPFIPLEDVFGVHPDLAALNAQGLAERALSEGDLVTICAAGSLAGTKTLEYAGV